LALILAVAEVAIITITITISTVAIAQEDRSGISELYPSATNGTEASSPLINETSFHG
jgi:hypothetical protein